MILSFRNRKRKRCRNAFTLLEVILSLALAALIAGVMGSLITMFLFNQEVGHDNVRQAQLARAVLNMISEDVRTTVRYQPFDTSGLQQLLGSGGGGGGGAGGGGAGGSAAAGGGAGGPSSSQSAASGVGSASAGASGASANTDGSSSGSMSSASGGTSGSIVTSSSGGMVASLPPGIYGTMNSIEIDVSRLPRPDEYVPQTTSISGGIGDMPSDIKTVGYFVQAPRTDGAQDPLTMLSQDRLVMEGNAAAPNNGGLVRRSIDRAVTQYAYENGMTDSLSRTGQIVAPEVVGIEFQYFDGTTWLTEWDSSQQGLPFVVKITIAMQKESYVRSKPITQGVAISSLTNDMLQEYGLEIYSTNTIIPGAQLLMAPQGTTATGSADTGMGAMGL